MSKEKRATEILNVNLAGIESSFTVAMSLIGEEHPAYKVLKGATERFDAMRDALITVQFYAAKI